MTQILSIDKMRVVLTESLPEDAKVRVENPDRWATVYGVFHNTDDKGKRTGKLSYSQKSIDYDTAGDPEFAIDLAAGTLTLPSGGQGRKPLESDSMDDIAASLAFIRNSAVEPDPETSTDQ